MLLLYYDDYQSKIGRIAGTPARGKRLGAGFWVKARVLGVSVGLKEQCVGV